MARLVSLLALTLTAACCFAADTATPPSGPYLGDVKYTVHLDGMLADILPQLGKITNRQITLAPPPKGEEPAKGLGKGGTPVSLNFDNSTLDRILMGLCKQVGLVYRLSFGNRIELIEGDPEVDPRPTVQVGAYTIRLIGCSVQNSRGYSLAWGKPFPETPNATGTLQVQLEVVPRTAEATQALLGLSPTCSATTDTGQALPASPRLGGEWPGFRGTEGDVLQLMPNNMPVIRRLFEGGDGNGGVRLEMRQGIGEPLLLEMPAVPRAPGLQPPGVPVPLPMGGGALVAPPPPGVGLGGPVNGNFTVTTTYSGGTTASNQGSTTVTMSLAAPGHDAKKLTKLEGQLRLRADVQKTEVTIKPADVGQIVTEGDAKVTMQSWKQEGDVTKVSVEIAMPPAQPPAGNAVFLGTVALRPRDGISAALLSADGRRREGTQISSSYDGKVRKITFQFGPPMALPGMPNAEADAKPLAPDHMMLTVMRTTGAEKLVPFVLTDITLP